MFLTAKSHSPTQEIQKKKNTKKKTAVRGKICVTYSDDDDTYEPVKKMTRVVNVCENKLMLYTKSNR